MPSSLEVARFFLVEVRDADGTEVIFRIQALGRQQGWCTVRKDGGGSRKFVVGGTGHSHDEPCIGAE
jgi:hypothetical protein